MLAAPLEAQPHTGERRSQIVRDVIAHAGNLMDECFDVAQHPVDAESEFVEGVITPVCGQALSQVTSHDALYFPIDFQEPLVSAHAQDHSDGDRQPERQNQSQYKRPSHDLRHLGEFVDISTDHENVAVAERVRREPDVLSLAAACIGPNDGSVRGNVRDETGWQAFDITRNAMTIGSEQACDLDAAGILAQSI